MTKKEKKYNELYKLNEETFAYIGLPIIVSAMLALVLFRPIKGFNSPFIVLPEYLSLIILYCIIIMPTLVSIIFIIRYIIKRIKIQKHYKED